MGCRIENSVRRRMKVIEKGRQNDRMTEVMKLDTHAPFQAAVSAFIRTGAAAMEDSQDLSETCGDIVQLLETLCDSVSSHFCCERASDGEAWEERERELLHSINER